MPFLLLQSIHSHCSVAISTWYRMKFSSSGRLPLRLLSKFWVLPLLSLLVTLPAMAHDASDAYRLSDIFQQERKVQGTVLSEDGEGLPGVSVFLKGTNVGTITDIDGAYSLTIPNEDQVLVFSFIGFETQEVKIGSRTRVDISLAPDITTLSEVVVVGYGQQKKEDLTGAVSLLSSEELQAMPIQNTLQGIQGRVSGIDITSNARPGEIGQVRIRGNRSINGQNTPLYVVDGVPLQSGGLEGFNPGDIASITILKDASATAIYGSRASNGVVLVTTKAGTPGSLRVNYDGSVILEKINVVGPMFNAPEYAEFRREALRNTEDNLYSTPYPNPIDDFDYFGSNDPSAWESIAAGYRWIDKEGLVPATRPTTAAEQALWGVSEVPDYAGSRVPTTNWTDYVEQTGVTQNHNLSISAGGKKSSTYVSGGYLDQRGTNIGQDFTRYTGMIKTQIHATDWFTFGGTLNANYSIQNYGYSAGGSRGSRTIFEAARGQLPYAVPYDSEGNYIFNPGGNDRIINPVRDTGLVINERTTLRAFGSFFAEAELTEGLRVKTIFGPDIRNYRKGEYQYAESSIRDGGGPSSTNFASFQQRQDISWTMENLLYYDRTFSNIHQLGFTLLQSTSLFRTENTSMSATDLPYDSQLWYNIGSNNNAEILGGSGFSKKTLSSYMARINYSLADKYLLTTSGRWDGASVLSEGYKWDFFPSLAVGWKLSEESFLQPIPWIDQLKLRFGLGATGNQAVGAYSTAGGLVRVPYVFGSEPANGYVSGNPKGSSQGSFPNRALGWERTLQWNYGIDFGLLQHRISGSIEYFIANTSDILLEKEPLSVTGYSNITINAGETQNKGIELTLSTVNVDKADLQWTTDLSLTRINSKITSLPNGQDIVNENLFIGEPLNVYYDLKKIGIWQEADRELMNRYNENGGTYKVGDIRVEDVNGDLTIDSNDRQVIGSRDPMWIGGLTNTLTYKGLSLSVFVFSRWNYTVEGGAADVSGQYASRKIDYWTPNNPTNEYPRPNAVEGSQPVHYSSMNYQDASFIKVRYISLNYNIPDKLIHKMGLRQASVYTQALNPFLYSKTDFIDPDSPYQNSGSNNSASSLSTRSLVFGVKLSF